MKKKLGFLFAVLLIAGALLSFTACQDKYAEYLGVYDCIYITRDGADILSAYEYYRIELKKGGNAHSEFKMKTAPYTSGETDSKFKIDGEKFIETVGVVKNEYKYIDGVIILEYQDAATGIKIVARFKRSA